VIGGFATVGGDGAYAPNYANCFVTLTRSDGPCPTRIDGDADGDGDIDLDDLLPALANFGLTCP
jgi:hypothetical protein